MEEGEGRGGREGMEEEESLQDGGFWSELKASAGGWRSYCLLAFLLSCFLAFLLAW